MRSMFSLNLSGSGVVLFVSIMCKYRMIFWFMESLLYIYTVLWKSWKFLAFTEGNWEPCWGIRVSVLVFCLSRPPKWAYWGTNHKYSTCFLKKLSIYFPENKNQEITGKISGNLQVIALLAVTLFWYFTCVSCSVLFLPSLVPSLSHGIRQILLWVSQQVFVPGLANTSAAVFVGERQIWN